MSSNADYARYLLLRARAADPRGPGASSARADQVHEDRHRAVIAVVLRELDEAGYYCDPSDGPHLRQIADEIEGDNPRPPWR